MNIHFQQVRKSPQMFFYILVAFTVFMVVMLTLSFSRHTELQLSVPSISVEAVRSQSTNLPVAFPAPLPPAEQAQTIATPGPVGDSQAALVPQAIAAPMPSMP